MCSSVPFSRCFDCRQLQTQPHTIRQRVCWTIQGSTQQCVLQLPMLALMNWHGKKSGSKFSYGAIWCLSTEAAEVPKLQRMCDVWEDLRTNHVCCVCSGWYPGFIPSRPRALNRPGGSTPRDVKNHQRSRLVAQCWELFAWAEGLFSSHFATLCQSLNCYWNNIMEPLAFMSNLAIFYVVSILKPTMFYFWSPKWLRNYSTVEDSVYVGCRNVSSGSKRNGAMMV